MYVKPTNSGLLLHYQSHVDNRYKKGLLRTTLDRTHRLSSSWTHFSDECDRLKTVFSRLKYPKHLVNSTIKSFVDSKVCDQKQPLLPSQEKDDMIRVVLPFKDQISADIVRKQLKDLSLKVHTTIAIQPVFVNRKIEQELNVKETKPPIANQQCVVYGFQCDLCDAGYVGYTRGHLHNRVKGHKQQSSAIAKHYKNMHGTMPQGLLERFKVFKNCTNKFDCLEYEMLFIRALKTKSQRASRLHSCESIFIIFLQFFAIFAPSYVNSSRQNRFKSCNLHDLFIFSLIMES